MIKITKHSDRYTVEITDSPLTRLTDLSLDAAIKYIVNILRNTRTTSVCDDCLSVYRQMIFTQMNHRFTSRYS